MADKLRIELIGFDAARKVMSRLPARVSKKILRSAGRKALQPMLKEARKNALSSKDEGTLIKSIGILTDKDKPRNVGAVVLAPRKGRRYKYDGWYAHLVEGGHDIVRGRSKSDKKKVGEAKPKPFMEPAIESKQQEVTTNYWIEVANSLEKEVKKIASRR